MGLQQEAAQLEVAEPLCKLQIGDPASDQVRLDVDVKVVQALDELEHGRWLGAGWSSGAGVGGKKLSLLGNGRRAVDVEARDSLETPGLTLRAFALRPEHGLPIGREDQISAGAHLDAVAGGLPGVEEERLLDRVLVWPRLDVDAVSRQMSAARRTSSRWSTAVGDVVQPAPCPGRVAAVGDLVRLLIGRQPDGRLRPSSSTICSVNRKARWLRKTRLSPGSSPSRLT